MFVISPHAAIPPFDSPDLQGPDHLRTYELEDEAGILRGRHAYEYDLIWKKFPPGVDQLVTHSLLSALREGAIIAWFGFEASFDFEHLLHPEIASQVYAVAAGDAVRLALDDATRTSSDWRQLLAALRDRVLQ